MNDKTQTEQIQNFLNLWHRKCEMEINTSGFAFWEKKTKKNKSLPLSKQQSNESLKWPN